MSDDGDSRLPAVSISTSWVADAQTWRLPDATTTGEVFLHGVLSVTAHPSGQLLLTAMLGDPEQPQSPRSFQIPLEVEDATTLRQFLAENP